MKKNLLKFVLLYQTLLIFKNFSNEEQKISETKLSSTENVSQFALSMKKVNKNLLEELKLEFNIFFDKVIDNFVKDGFDATSDLEVSKPCRVTVIFENKKANTLLLDFYDTESNNKDDIIRVTYKE